LHTPNHHLKAWEAEHQHNIWKGPYSLDFFHRYAPSSGLVLDAGSGIGRYSIPLALRHYNVVGIDISQTAIKKLEDKRRRRNIKLGLGVADVCHLPFKNTVFDAIVCFGVVQHLLENERLMALTEFSRVLIPGSVLIMEVLGREDMRAGGREVEPCTYQRDTGSVYHYFTKQELIEIFSDFEILEIKENKHSKNLGGKEYMRHMISAAVRSIE
jgi:SAM-dependent methyltransferase